MVVTIRGTDYECRTATKKGNTVTLYLGKYDEYGNEIVSTFIDFPDKDIVGLEDINEPTQDERIAELEEALELLLSGVTEE